MPLYEYECPDCGPFTAWRAMAESGAPVACARCAGLSARILSATSAIGGRGRKRGIPEPRLVRRQEGPAAGTQGGGHGHGHDRPWMIGH